MVREQPKRLLYPLSAAGDVDALGLQMPDERSPDQVPDGWQVENELANVVGQMRALGNLAEPGEAWVGGVEGDGVKEELCTQDRKGPRNEAE